jgi:hypothetical protein
MLDNDLTRCLGEGNAGAICQRRQECDRYLAIAEDEARDARTGQRPFRRMEVMLCRPPNMAYFWPVENSR